MQVLCANQRGCTSNWETTYLSIRDKQPPPDIIILTETKLTSDMTGMRGLIARDMKHYHLHHSSIPNNTGQKIPGRAGVLLPTHTSLGPPTKVEILPTLAGHLAHVTLDYKDNAIHIVGVYAPTDEPATKQKMYNHLQHLTQTLPK